MEFCEQSWIFANFAPEFFLLVTTTKLSSHLKAKTSWMHNREERWSWKMMKWSWKSRGKIYCQVCRNPENNVTVLWIINRSSQHTRTQNVNSQSLITIAILSASWWRPPHPGVPGIPGMIPPVSSRTVLWDFLSLPVSSGHSFPGDPGRHRLWGPGTYMA